MRAQLRNIAIFVVALAIVAAATLLLIPPTVDASSRGVGRTGTAALYDWMSSLGYPVQRIEGSFSLDGVGTVVSANPTRPYSNAEAEQISVFVDQGGTFVVASSSPTELGPLLRLTGVGIDGSALTTAASPANPQVAGKVSKLEVRDPLVLRLPGDATPLVSVDSGVIAASVPMGNGHIVIVGDGFFFANDGLRDADNALFALYVIESGNRSGVGFDDFHHSQQTADGQAAILHSPLGLSLGLAVLVLVAWALSSGRNLGRALPAGDPGLVPSATIYIHSMAQLFGRAGIRAGVAERYRQAALTRIGTVTGVAATLDDTAFVAALTGIDSGLAARTGAVLAKATALSRGNPETAELVAVAAEIDAVEGAWSQPLAQWRA